jgi:hypothetical protein
MKNVKVNAVIAGIKSNIKKQQIKNLTGRIKAAMPVKGKGTTILEAIGTEISQSGGKYENCKNSNEAAAILLAQLDRIIFSTQENPVIYKSDELLLISIDGQFYEITASDLKSSILKLAQNAGLPSIFIGVQLAKLLIEGFIGLFKKYDTTFNEKSSRLLGV